MVYTDRSDQKPRTYAISLFAHTSTIFLSLPSLPYPCEMFNPCRSALATLPNAFISPYHLIGSTFRPPSFRPINTCQSPQKYTTTSFPVTTTPTCVWVETSAAVTIEMPPEEAYDYYTDLEAMPKWYVSCTSLCD